MTTLYPTISRPLQLAAASAAVMLATACSGGSSFTPAAASAGAVPPAARALVAPKAAAPDSFTFTTLDDQSDPTFNQLLGINNKGIICGYFGSGMPGHPNKGYQLDPPYGQADYVNENFPGSAQTQVTSINDHGDTAGFWANPKNANFGWIEWNGVFTSYKDPLTHKGKVNQVLGINNKGIAVGFYNDAQGNSHAFVLDQATGKFTSLKAPGAQDTTASAINSNGDIVGFYKSSSGTASFLLMGKKFSALQFPGGSNTQAFGVNDMDQIVGSYNDSAGVMHGFMVSDPLKHAKWQTIDDPNGVGSTVVNGLNDNKELVGFYTDASGNTDGMLVNY